MEKKRNISLDGLRILSMLMIIMLHLLGTDHGNVLSATRDFTLQWYVTWGIEAVCIVAVNCYVLISAFFLSDTNTKFSGIKFIKICFEVWFYSISIFTVLFLSGKATISLSTLLIAFCPILSRSYWFVSSYLCMYVLFPFLNRLIEVLDKENYKLMLLVLLVTFSVIPTLYPFVDTFETGGGTGVVWFCVLYFVAAYIKRFGIRQHWKSINWAGCYLGITILIAFSKFCIAFVSKAILGKAVGTTVFWGYNSPFVLLSSVALFMFFCKLPDYNGKRITWLTGVSSTTFGIYLIHDNPFMRPLLWRCFNIEIADKNIFILVIQLIGIVLAVFICCMFIDLIRKTTIYLLKLGLMIGGKYEK